MKNIARVYLTRLGFTACAATALLTGCASMGGQDPVADQKVSLLQGRLEESERLNGRLSVRLEELEDEVFLLQDRVEANRLSLQRKGFMRGAVAQGLALSAPSPPPESHYNGSGYQGAPPANTYRDVKRIPLPQPVYHDPYVDPYQNREPAQRQYAEQVPTNTVGSGGARELVITNKELRAFAGKPPAAPGRSKGKRTSTKAAQAPVTAEKLATTGSLKRSSASALESPATPTERTQRRDALGIYKDSLAQYRTGNYAQALRGFEEFLASGPRDDYVDNALYWIGECQFGLGEFDGAVSYFRRVVSEQPDGNKVPDAMLKMSLAYDRLGQTENSKKSLRQLTSQYPATNAGKAGQKKLDSMN